MVCMWFQDEFNMEMVPEAYQEGIQAVNILGQASFRRVGAGLKGITYSGFRCGLAPYPGSDARG